MITNLAKEERQQKEQWGGWGLEFIGERGVGQNLEKWVDSIRGVLIK